MRKLLATFAFGSVMALSPLGIGPVSSMIGSALHTSSIAEAHAGPGITSTCIDTPEGHLCESHFAGIPDTIGCVLNAGSYFGARTWQLPATEHCW